KSGDGERMFGIGGETRVEVAFVDELRIGGAVNKGLSILVAGERDAFGNIALLLGADFFDNVDVEFDLPHNAVRLYQSRDCDGARLAYWADRGAAELPMESVPKIVLQVKINDEPVRALLDSGAATSVLAAEDARRLGVTPESPGVVSGGCSYGIGQKPVDGWIGQFRSFAMDNELIHDPKINFAELWRHTTYTATGSHVPRRLAGLPEMLLGVDFLRAHRVLIAHSQRKVYFTYTGGPVFFTRQGKPCGETSPDLRKGSERAKD
ncbi:MAG: aspartyl protease family protein, partial [Acidobacteriota bacterium]